MILLLFIMNQILVVGKTPTTARQPKKSDSDESLFCYFYLLTSSVSADTSATF
jgi:hypothetical protein